LCKGGKIADRLSGRIAKENIAYAFQMFYNILKSKGAEI